jgi:pyruvate carboxylase
VFLEKYIPRAKHIEVQILGDQHGNVIHLHERDCSVQRRHQKVIEQAPSYGLPEQVVIEAVRRRREMAREIRTTTPARSSSSTISTGRVVLHRDEPAHPGRAHRDRGHHRHRPRPRQILIAQGTPCIEEVGMPAQDDIPRNGYAIQCRITTEDPENKFTPDYGRILTYRSPGGFGVRLDGGMGFAGAVITPFYDSMLVKVTVFGRTYDIALRPHGPRPARVPHPRREDEHPVPRERHRHPDVPRRPGHHALIDTTPSCSSSPRARPRHEAAQLPRQRHRERQSARQGLQAPARPAPRRRPLRSPHRPARARAAAARTGPEEVRRVDAKQKRCSSPTPPCATRTSRSGHPHAHLRHAGLRRCASRTPHPGLFSLEMWGGATFDTAMRFLNEDPWERLRQLRARVPNICFQMLFRGSNAVGYTNYPDNVVAGFVKHAAASGMDIFRIFDSLNYLPNLTRGDGGGAGDTTRVCEGRALLHRRHPRSEARQVRPQVLRPLAKELERMGAHMLASRTWPASAVPTPRRSWSRR